MIDLTPILIHLPAWAMVLARLTGLFLLAPLLGSQAIPRMTKVFLAVTLSLCVYPALITPGHPAAPGAAALWNGGLELWTLLPAVAMELLLGFVVGYAASLPLVGMQMAGHLVDQQMGLGLAGIYNPELNEQSSIVGEFLFMTGLAMFCIVGGHHAMFGVLLESFAHVPLGGFADPLPIVQLALGLISVSFELALRVAAPLLCLMFLLSVAMGFIARTVPQMNILSVGFAVRIIAGVGFLAVCVPLVGPVLLQAMHEAFEAIRSLWPQLASSRQ